MSGGEECAREDVQIDRWRMGSEKPRVRDGSEETHGGRGEEGEEEEAESEGGGLEQTFPDDAEITSTGVI